MHSNKGVSRVLGAAFVLQFVTSFLNGTFITPALIVPESIVETMENIASHAGLMRATILVDVITAMGIVFLGAMLYLAVRHQNEKVALVGLGLYILEAALLAVSKLDAFTLLRISQEYAGTSQSTYMLTMGAIALEAMDFVGGTLHVLVFSVGAILFYYLLYQSNLLPKVLSLWGLITVIPLLIGMVTLILGYEMPFVFYIPYVPFEFVVGIWILIKGIRTESGSEPALT